MRQLIHDLHNNADPYLQYERRLYLIGWSDEEIEKSVTTTLSSFLDLKNCQYIPTVAKNIVIRPIPSVTLSLVFHKSSICRVVGGGVS